MIPPYAVRRLLLPVLLAMELAVLALLVVTLVAGVISAPLDRRVRLARLSLMGGAYLILEWVGLAALAALWALRPLRRRVRAERAEVAVVGWLLGRVLAAARRTVRFSVQLDEPAVPGPFGDPDPVLVLARHGGIGDSFALVWLLAERYRRRPRVVLKQLLQWDPLIDVALSRMGACFLPPSASGTERLVDRVGELAEGLAPGEALLLFPEGGNWTPRRRLRAIGRLWAARRPAEARTAALLDHVLPPRAGGVLACLQARPDIPVVIVAHTGLDKITSARQLWRSVPFSRAMQVRWWPPAQPPYGEAERLAWLSTEWAVIDQWIDARNTDDGHRR